MDSTKPPTHHLDEEEENVDLNKLHAAVGQQKVVLLNYLVAVFSAIGTFLFGCEYIPFCQFPSRFCLDGRNGNSMLSPFPSLNLPFSHLELTHHYFSSSSDDSGIIGNVIVFSVGLNAV
jgi:hypothetical protein